MYFWLLPESGIPIARSTVQAVSEEELRSEEIQCEIMAYDANIMQKLNGVGDDGYFLNVNEELTMQEVGKANQDAMDGIYAPLEPEAEKSEIQDYNEDMYSKFTSAEVLLPKGDYQYVAKVIGRKRDGDGNPIRRYHPNLILDTTVHEGEFLNGSVHDYAANVLAEALFS